MSAGPFVLSCDEAVHVKVLERSLGGAPGQSGSGLDLSSARAWLARQLKTRRLADGMELTAMCLRTDHRSWTGMFGVLIPRSS